MNSIKIIFELKDPSYKCFSYSKVEFSKMENFSEIWQILFI